MTTSHATTNPPPSPPPDDAQRKAALDPRRSFIVQAPAGSGKTELLVRRYLALLATVDAPEQILAITFTKKATAEMRLRVLRALKRIKADGSAEDNAEILALADAARANDKKHEWRLADNTRRIRIQTIDAFCNELVWRMPWSARFGSPPEIIADAAPLFLEAAKHSLDHIERGSRSQWADACQQLLALADADWSKAQTLLAGMLKNRDQWMRLLGHAGRDDLERMWQQGIEREMQAALTPLMPLTPPGSRVCDLDEIIPPPQQAQLLELAVFAAGNLTTAGKESAIRALHEAQHFPQAAHRHIDQWHGLATLALTNAGGLRKTVTVAQGFPAQDKTEKARMLDLLAQWSEQPGWVDALTTLRALPRGQFSEAQWRSIDALVQLLRLAAAELRLLFKERNQADYIEMTQRAEMALGEPDNPSDLALAFDYQLRHLLMDEFQDTSSAHVELLTRMTAGWQPDDGRTLFFVGDPMQSIYRFREAEVANFLQVKEAGLGGIALDSITLEANFRSAPPLVDWFNDTFAQVLPARDDIANSAVSYARASAHTAGNQAGAETSEARLHPGINANNKDAAAETIAALIEQAQQHDREQRIAVLGRTRRHLGGVAAALRRRGIAFRGRDLEKLNDRPAILDLMALTRALVQPADRIAWLSLLRAPWCGLDLADLSALAADDHSATLLELWRDDARLAALSADGKARLQRLADCLDAALNRRGRIGLRRNVEAAWLALGGPATIAAAHAADLDDCRRYLDLLGELEAERADITPARLQNATDNLWAQGGADAKVELLTIHKAKGLEFDTVFLPQLDGRTRAAEKPLLRWRKLPEQLLLAPLPSSGDPDDPFYRYLEHLEAAHAKNEAGRLLYVACTRAKKNLHLFGNASAKDGEVRAPGATSLLSLLWPLVEGDYVAAAESAEVAESAAATDTRTFEPAPLYRLPRDWSPPALPSSIPVKTTATGALDPVEFSWAGEAARITGIVIHQILQRADAGDWERHRQTADTTEQARWRNQLIENGIAEDRVESALAHVIDAIQKTRHDPRAAWIFSAAHHDIKREWPLTGSVDGRLVHIVIDRSFTDENGIRWIIDFKSGRHEGANPNEFLNQEQTRHHPQLSRYAAIVQQLQPHKVRLGLYFPSLPGWREWAG